MKVFFLTAKPIAKVGLVCLLGGVLASCDYGGKKHAVGYPPAITDTVQNPVTRETYDCEIGLLKDWLAEDGYKDLMPHPLGISSPVMQDFLYNDQRTYGGSKIWSSGNWVPGILYFRRRYGPNSWWADASILVTAAVGDGICEEDPNRSISEVASLLRVEFRSQIEFIEDRKIGVVFDFSAYQPCEQAPDYRYDSYDLFCRAFFPEKFTDQGIYQISPTKRVYDDRRLRTFSDRCASSHPDPAWLIDSQKPLPTWEAVCAQFERPGTAITESILLTSPGYLTQIRQKRCMSAVAWLDNFRQYTDTGKVVDYVWRTQVEYMETVPSNTGFLVAWDRPSGFPRILDKAAAVSSTEMTSVRENIKALSQSSCSDLWGNIDYCVVSDGITTPVGWPIDACDLPWKARLMNPTSATYETVSAKMWVLPLE